MLFGSVKTVAATLTFIEVSQDRQLPGRRDCSIVPNVKYAVIRIAGRQLKVNEGQEIKVTAPEQSEAEVLLKVSDDKVDIGEPVLATKAKLEMLGIEKGKKIDILRFKAKSRYSKHTGFRSLLRKYKVVSF